MYKGKTENVEFMIQSLYLEKSLNILQMILSSELELKLGLDFKPSIPKKIYS